MVYTRALIDFSAKYFVGDFWNRPILVLALLSAIDIVAWLLFLGLRPIFPSALVAGDSTLLFVLREFFLLVTGALPLSCFFKRMLKLCLLLDEFLLDMFPVFLKDRGSLILD